MAGLTTLSEMGDKPKPHADKVAALLKDTSPEVRELAVTLLVDWRHSSPEIVQELSAMAAGDEDAVARSSAMVALSTLGAQEEFLKASKAILAGDDASVKGEIIMALRDEGKESLTAVKAELEALASGSDKDLASQAKDALGELK